MATIIPNAGAAGWESSADLGQMYTSGLQQGMRAGMEAATAKNLKLMDQLQALKLLAGGILPDGKSYTPNASQADTINQQIKSIEDQLATSMVLGRRPSMDRTREAIGGIEGFKPTSSNAPKVSAPGKKLVDF